MPILGRDSRAHLLGMARQYIPPGTREQFAPLGNLLNAGARAVVENPVGSALMAMDYVGPAADVKDMRNYSAATMDELRQGNYGLALANLGMTGAALAMTALPGSVGAVDDAIKGAAKKADELPMDTASRMKRAEEMGFDIDAYKGGSPYDSASLPIYKYPGGIKTHVKGTGESPIEIDSFSAKAADIEGYVGKGGSYSGFFSDRKDVANKFAELGGAVFPVKLRFDNPLVIDAKGENYAGEFQFIDRAKAAGKEKEWNQIAEVLRKDGAHDGVIIKNTIDEGTVYVPKKGRQSRSRHAEFDPAKKDSANLLAGVGGAGLLGLGLTQREDEY